MSSTCRVSATSWTRYTCAPSHAETAVVASVPTHPLLDRPVEGLAHEVLVGQRHQHRPARLHHLAEPPGRLQAVPGVLPEVVPGIDQDRLPRAPPGTRRARPGRASPAGCRPSRRRRRPGAAGSAARRLPACVHTSPAPYRAATSASRGSTPPQASFSRSAPASQTASPTSCRQVSTLITTSGKRAAHLGDETDRAARLLRGGDLLARARLHPADVDDGRALGHRLLHARERGLVAEGGALVVERVRGPVHDRHDHRLVRVEFAPAQPEHPL